MDRLSVALSFTAQISYLAFADGAAEGLHTQIQRTANDTGLQVEVRNLMIIQMPGEERNEVAVRLLWKSRRVQGSRICMNKVGRVIN